MSADVAFLIVLLVALLALLGVFFHLIRNGD